MTQSMAWRMRFGPVIGLAVATFGGALLGVAIAHIAPTSYTAQVTRDVVRTDNAESESNITLGTRTLELADSMSKKLKTDAADGRSVVQSAVDHVTISGSRSPAQLTITARHTERSQAVAHVWEVAHWVASTATTDPGFSDISLVIPDEQPRVFATGLQPLRTGILGALIGVTAWFGLLPRRARQRLENRAATGNT